jgi:ketosteroid isomerase-like protein
VISVARAGDVVLGAICAVEQRVGRALMAHYRDDVVVHDAPSLPYGGVTVGKAAVESGLRASSGWLATWGPLQPSSTERAMDAQVIAENDTGDVVVLYRQRAVSPGGRRFDAPVLGLYRVVGNKLARLQMFHYDTAAIVDFLEKADVHA